MAKEGMEMSRKNSINQNPKELYCQVRLLAQEINLGVRSFQYRKYRHSADTRPVNEDNRQIDIDFAFEQNVGPFKK